MYEVPSELTLAMSAAYAVPAIGGFERSRMSSRAIAAVIALSCAATAPIAVTEAVASPAAQMACLHAKIGGHRKCLAKGQSCVHRYQRQYENYGFSCVKLHGHYRLTFAQQQQQ